MDPNPCVGRRRRRRKRIRGLSYTSRSMYSFYVEPEIILVTTKNEFDHGVGTDFYNFHSLLSPKVFF
jgi:hypothetical protein